MTEPVGPLGIGATVRRPGSFLPVVLCAAAAVIVLAGLRAFAGLVSLVALSVLVSVLLAPLRSSLAARGWPGWLSLVVVLGLYLVVLAIAAGLVVIGVIGFVRDLPAYRDELEALLQRLGLTADDPGPLDPDANGGSIRAVAAGVIDNVVAVGYSVFVVAYLLVEAPAFPDRLRWAAGPRTTAVERGARLAERLRTYVVARAILGGIAAVLDTILLVVLGVPSALLWGILSFLLSFVPNIGFILALIPPAALGLLVGGPLTAILVVVGYCVINIAIDYVVQPRFVGSQVDLSATVVTVSLLFWAVVLGGAGAILAVPMTIAAAALLDAFDDSRPLARLLGAAGPDPATG
jgi:predicted PurR-regulated permease PerM